MNVNLGVPYEAIIKKIIRTEYAASQTEAIRQALLAYERDLEEEEVMLVNKGIAIEMEKMKSGKVKTYSFRDIKRRFMT